KRALIIGDAIDGEIADADGLHLSSLPGVWRRPTVAPQLPRRHPLATLSPRAARYPVSPNMRVLLAVAVVALLYPAVGLAQSRGGDISREEYVNGAVERARRAAEARVAR